MPGVRREERSVQGVESLHDPGAGQVAGNPLAAREVPEVVSTPVGVGRRELIRRVDNDLPGPAREVCQLRHGEERHRKENELRLRRLLGRYCARLRPQPAHESFEGLRAPAVADEYLMAVVDGLVGDRLSHWPCAKHANRAVCGHGVLPRMTSARADCLLSIALWAYIFLPQRSRASGADECKLVFASVRLTH